MRNRRYFSLVFRYSFWTKRASLFNLFTELSPKLAETDVFETIIHQAIKHQLISGRDLFTDSTHIKANANKRTLKEEITTYVKERKRALETEINQIRAELGKEGFDFEDHLESKTTKVSTVDPDSGYYHRDEKEKGFMYLDHRAVDGLNNLIVDAHISPGNVHDSRPYLGRLLTMLNRYGFKTKRFLCYPFHHSVVI